MQKIVILLIVLLVSVKSEYHTYGQYSLCMADQNIGSFYWTLQYQCDNDCLFEYMKFDIDQDFNSSDMCQKVRDFKSQEIIPTGQIMPGDEILGCELEVGYPTNTQALAVIQAQNECVGITNPII